MGKKLPHKNLRREGYQLDWDSEVFRKNPKEFFPDKQPEDIPINDSEEREAFYQGVRERLLRLIGDLNYAESLAKRCMANIDTFKGFVFRIYLMDLPTGPELPSPNYDKKCNDLARDWKNLFKDYPARGKRFKRGEMLAEEIKEIIWDELKI